MKFLKYIAAILFLFLSIYSFGQKRKNIPPEKPKLVVTIVVEQMRYDVIYRYWNKFGEGGFKRLVDEGSFCRNAHYNYLFTQSSVGYATIASGTYPSYHGIVADEWFDRVKEEIMYCAEDLKAVPTNYISQAGNRSPKKMLTTTFSDELKLFNADVSKSIGISLKDYGAIFPAGHKAEAAYWFDFEKGNWLTSNYYMDSLPDWVLEFNEKKFADLYLDRMWNTKLDIDQYLYDDIDSYGEGLYGQFEFPYDLSKLRKEDKDYSLLLNTPYGNTLTKDFAIATILNEQLGVDDTTDFISVSFTSNGGAYKLFGPGSVELEDMYLRLDEEIEHLLTFIDENFGKENVMVVFTSDHGSVDVPDFLADNKIPSGYFNYKKAFLLLNSYLNFTYGKGDWISFYHKQQVYLNHILIEESEIDLSAFQNTVADFLIQFAGVANTVTSTTLKNNYFGDGIFKQMQNSFNQNRSGDVIINLEPGWIEQKSIIESENSSYSYDTHVPLVWYGWKIGRKTIDRKIDMIDIAPTITYFLEISKPNGSVGEVIFELVD
jgi:predicted AlkP superfamily pyrophosphatase or phosphodiesterase